MEIRQSDSEVPRSPFRFQEAGIASDVRAEESVSRIQPDSLSKLASLEMSLSAQSDFFHQWLQDEISTHLPHNTLLAAWGNFQTGELNYDVASTSSDLSTRDIYNNPSFGSLASTLYNRARKEKGGWYILKDNAELEALAATVNNFSFLKSINEKMKSVLIYTMPGEHAADGSLYIFFNKENRIDIETSTLHSLMPHVDAALRQVSNH